MNNGEKVRDMLKEKIKVEALRTYLFIYSSMYDAIQLDQLVSMFELTERVVHSTISKMMIRDEITAAWDESSKFVLVLHSEPTTLQRLALQLADRSNQAADNNERLLDQKTNAYGFEGGKQGKGVSGFNDGFGGRGRKGGGGKGR